MLIVNFKIILPVILIGLLGGTVGNLLNERWPDRLQPHGLIVGTVAGLLLGLTLGLALSHQRRRWIAAAVVTMQLLLAYLYAGPWNALLAALAVAITLFISAGILRDLYGGNEWEAFRHHLSVWLSMRGGFIVVNNGKIEVPAKAGMHFGPKLIIVRPGNMVTMVSGPAISRLCGPSIFMSANFEYVSSVVSIERQRHNLSLTDALTRTQDPIGVALTYKYGVNVTPDTICGNNARIVHQQDGSRGMTSRELITMRSLVTTTPDWNGQVHRIMQSATRCEIARYAYKELIPAFDLQHLAREIAAKALPAVKKLGCGLYNVTVTHLSPSEEATDFFLESQHIRVRHQAEGEGFRLAIASIAKGYDHALKSGMSIDDVHREAERYMMEHITHDPATKVILTELHQRSLDGVQSPASIIDELIDQDTGIPHDGAHTKDSQG